MNKGEGKQLRRVLAYYSYLLLVWGFFRLLFKFPDLIEEMWFKPVLWLLPLFWVWFGDKNRVKFFNGKWIKTLLWGAGLGVAYMAVAGIAAAGKKGVWMMPGMEAGALAWMDVVGLGLVTAISEETVFSGYIFQRLKGESKNFWAAAVTTAILFAIMHIPVSIFVLNYNMTELVSYLWLVILVTLGNNWLMWKTGNVIAPIMSHWLWGVAIFLFR